MPLLAPERTQFRDERLRFCQGEFDRIERRDPTRNWFVEALGYFNGERRSLPNVEHLYAIAFYYEGRLEIERATVAARDAEIAAFHKGQE